MAEKKRIAQDKQLENATALQNIIASFEESMKSFIGNMNTSSGALSQGA